MEEETKRGREWRVSLSKRTLLRALFRDFSRSSRCPGGGPIGVSRSTRTANQRSRPDHVGLLLSISCFSRTGGRPAGAVKADW